VHLDSEYDFMVQGTCRDDLVKTHALIRFPAARARNCLDPAGSVDSQPGDDSRMECVPAAISCRQVLRNETRHDSGSLGFGCLRRRKLSCRSKHRASRLPEATELNNDLGLAEIQAAVRPRGFGWDRSPLSGLST
jgi:hypothetical protein